MIYLDYAANTPVDKEVLDNYIKVTNKYIANPNSSHKLGIMAKNEIDKNPKNNVIENNTVNNIKNNTVEPDDEQDDGP